jgi:hypothetical protein
MCVEVLPRAWIIKGEKYLTPLLGTGRSVSGRGDKKETRMNAFKTKSSAAAGGKCRA